MIFWIPGITLSQRTPMGNIPYTLWQYAEKKSGAHIWAYNGCYVAVTDKFVAHQNTKSTKCEITLPFECELEEIFDGGLYKTKNKKLCYKAKIGETKLFKIKAI